VTRGEKAAIVVLGGALKQGPNGCWRTTRFDESDHGGVLGDYVRVIAASYLAKENPGHIVIASGGQDNPGEPFVAEVIKAELIQKGIPCESIIVERESHNTHEQLREVEKILSEKGIARLILISNRYHVQRIRALLKKMPGLSQLRQLFEGGYLLFQSAEEILLDRDHETWQPIIDAAYESRAMQQRMERESTGTLQIKAGTYKYERS
jgi:DUF218 domain